MDVAYRLVVNPNGVVVGADGGPSQRWLDRSASECEDMPVEVRRAVADVVRELHDSAGRLAVRTVSPAGSEGPVQVTALSALALRRRPTDLRTVLDWTRTVLDGQAKAIGVRLEVAISERIPSTVFLDSEKVAWVLTALVGNALRYVKPGSGTVPGGRVRVDASYDQSASQITISVADDGPGIPVDKLQLLFRRGGRHPYGAGLGLLLVHDIVTAHGGYVDVESSSDPVGHGTRIRVTLPAD